MFAQLALKAVGLVFRMFFRGGISNKKQFFKN